MQFVPSGAVGKAHGGDRETSIPIAIRAVGSRVLC